MENDIQFNHSITLNERKNLLVTGVKKIDHFDTNEFLIETNMGYLYIKWSELELIKLDTFKGNVTIKGIVNSMVYNDKDKVKEDGIISRLFKW